MENGRIFSRATQSIVFNFKVNAVQRMLDFDYLCRRDTPSVAALVMPGRAKAVQKFFFGAKEIALTQYGSTQEAAKAHPNADVFINFASFRKAFDTTMDAIVIPTIRTLCVIAEGVPEQCEQQLAAKALELQKVIIGPATVGGIQAGAFKIANTAGTVQNIIASKLHRPGHVGFVSKSGGMSNEMYRTIAYASDGIFEGIAVGGDAFPGSTLLDHLLRYEKMPEVKLMVMLGEIGGVDEYEIVDAVKSGMLKKPLVAWVTGTCSTIFPSEVQFGHAGAKSGGAKETAQAKNAALKAAGIHVPGSFEGFRPLIKDVFDEMVKKGEIVPAPDVEPRELPSDYAALKKAGAVRRPTSFISTICNDTGEEPTYAKVPMSEVIEGGYSIGDVISLLWFRKKLPPACSQMIEMCIKLTADHGPCVSGAHNAIVASRAGKDLMSCIASGLLCIGPRFGGAIDDAARFFKEAHDMGQSPADFVEGMTKKGIRVPGIGHKIKSATNPDKRVELLKNFVTKNFPDHRYLDYALTVEQYTLQKANNLILNVDGCIGVCFIDCLRSAGVFSEAEVEELLHIGFLNGLFALGRTIGIIGHALDQKRYGQPLYRHPTDDVCYYEDWE